VPENLSVTFINNNRFYYSSLSFQNSVSILHPDTLNFTRSDEALPETKHSSLPIRWQGGLLLTLN